jgi:hypothetical protein
MGGMGFRRHEGRVTAIDDIVNNGYKFIVVLNGVSNETQKPIRGGYALFQEAKAKDIREYAKARAEEAGADLTGIDVYALNCKLYKKIRV